MCSTKNSADMLGSNAGFCRSDVHDINLRIRRVVWGPPPTESPDVLLMFTCRVELDEIH